MPKARVCYSAPTARIKVTLGMLRQTGTPVKSACSSCAYQRPPRSRPPPSRRGRSVCGRASFTVSVLPSNSFPFMSSIAFWASSSVDISTNPNPFERPLMRSWIIAADSTVPACANASCNELSVVSYDKPPIYNFLAIGLSLIKNLLSSHHSLSAQKYQYLELKTAEGRLRANLFIVRTGNLSCRYTARSGHTRAFGGTRKLFLSAIQ